MSQATQQERKRVELHAGGIAVIADPDRRDPGTGRQVHGGVNAYGALQVGTVYVVEPAEAVRLVTCKRFDYASAADRKAGERFIADAEAAAKRAKAPPAGAEAPATAVKE